MARPHRRSLEVVKQTTLNARFRKRLAHTPSGDIRGYIKV